MTIYLSRISLELAYLKHYKYPFFSVEYIENDPEDGLLFRKMLLIYLLNHIQIAINWDRDYSIKGVGSIFSFRSILFIGLFLAYLYFKFS